jgi:hypothetical protein
VAETIAGGVGAVTPAVVVVVTPVVAGVVTASLMVMAISKSTNKTNIRCWLRALATGPPWLRGVRSSLGALRVTKPLSLGKDDATEVDVALLPMLAVPAVLRPPLVAGMSISASTVRSSLPGTMAVVAVVAVLAVPAELDVLRPLCVTEPLSLRKDGATEVDVLLTKSLSRRVKDSDNK